MMQNKFRIGIFVISAALGTQVFAACEKPVAPTIPDGMVADEDAMVDAQQAVKSYVGKAETYLDCVVTENKAALAGNTDTPETKQARSDTYDAVFKSRESVPTAFNAELRKFKSRPDQQ